MPEAVQHPDRPLTGGDRSDCVAGRTKKDERLAAIAWTKRYGKNCMDSFQPAGSDTASATTSALLDRTNSSSSKGLSPTLEPHTAARSASRRVTPGRRPVSAGAKKKKKKGSASRASSLGLVLTGLAEQERRLSSVNFLRDDAEHEQQRYRQKQRPGSTSTGSRRRIARPASAPTRRRQRPPVVTADAGESAVAAATAAELSLPQQQPRRPRPASASSVRRCHSLLAPVLERQASRSKPRKKKAIVHTAGHDHDASGWQPLGTISTSSVAPVHIADSLDDGEAVVAARNGLTAGWQDQVLSALDGVRGKPWAARRLVCCAVLDELATRTPELATLLRRVGGEIGADASCSGDAGWPGVGGEAVAAAEARARQALAAVAHHQRQAAAQRAKIKELEAELTQLRSAAKAGAGVVEVAGGRATAKVARAGVEAAAAAAAAARLDLDPLEAATTAWLGRPRLLDEHEVVSPPHSEGAEEEIDVLGPRDTDLRHLDSEEEVEVHQHSKLQQLLSLQEARSLRDAERGQTAAASARSKGSTIQQGGSYLPVATVDPSLPHHNPGILEALAALGGIDYQSTTGSTPPRARDRERVQL
jgi:hypothetical protein